jgi:2'-5' RNA ligase
MRTFLAIELPSALRAQLGLIQRQVRAHLHQMGAADCFNWTAPDKIHLTLRFLGETDQPQCTQLAAGLVPIAAQQPQMQLILQGVGCFPNFRAPNVIWLGLGGAMAELQRLQRQIEDLVQAVGFAPEQRPFAPHLTIARAHRNADHAQQHMAGEALRNSTQRLHILTTNHDALQFAVAEFVHMQSELRPEGACYTALRHFVFGRQGLDGETVGQ